MKTLQEVVTLSVQYVRERRPEISRADIEWVIATSLNMSRLDLYLYFQKPLEENELTKVREKILRISRGEPIQYVIGYVDFFNCTIHVTPSVLIPRPETEELVAVISRTIQKSHTTLWDICTGSGCIGIALKKKHPELSVVASDISQDALSIAKENALYNNVVVSFLEGDLLEPFFEKKADIIVSNPPYIEEVSYQTLDSTLYYEPKNALIGGKTGFEFYERFSHDLDRFLNPGGVFFCEVGIHQAERVQCLLESLGDVSILKDQYGIDRFCFLQK